MAIGRLSYEEDCILWFSLLRDKYSASCDFYARKVFDEVKALRLLNDLYSLLYK